MGPTHNNPVAQSGLRYTQRDALVASTRRAWTRRGGRCLAGLLIVVGLFAFMLWWPSDGPMDAGDAAHETPRPTGMNIPPVDIALDSLTLSDSSGPWLTMSGLRLSLAVDSRDASVIVKRADIERLIVMRRPASEGVARDPVDASVVDTSGLAVRGEASPGNRLARVIVETFKIVNLEIEPAVTGLRHDIHAQVDGRLTWEAGGALDGEVSVAVTEPERIQSRLTFSMDEDRSRLILDADIVAGDNGRWDLRLAMEDGAFVRAAVSGALGRLTISGDGELDLRRSTPRLNAQVDVQLAARQVKEGDPAGLASWIDVGLPYGQGVVRLQAESRDARQSLRGDVRLAAMTIGEGHVEGVTISTVLTDVFGDSPAFEIDLDLQNIAMKDGVIQAARLRGDGRWVPPASQSSEPDLAGGIGFGGLWHWLDHRRQRWMASDARLKASVSLNGEFRDMPFDLQTAARLRGRLTPDGDQRLFIDHLQAALADVEVDLRTPLHVSRSGDGFEIHPLLIRIGPSYLGGGARIRSDALRIRGAWQTPSLQWIPAVGQRGIEAAMRADWLVTGDPRQPDVESAVTLSNIVIAARPSVSAWLTRVDARLSASAAGMIVEAGAYGMGTNLIQLHSVFPSVLRMDPRPTLVPASEGSLSGWLTGAIPLAWVGDLGLPDDTRRIDGMGAMTLQWEDQGEGPRVTGQASVRDGSFHDLLTGTRLRDIQLVVKGDERGVVIDQGSARDRGDGRLTLSGRVDLWPWGRWPHHVEMRLARMRLVERDDVTAFLDGRLTLAGDYTASQLKGHVVLSPVEIRIPDRLPAVIPSLPVVDPARPHPPTDERASLFPWLALDVTVEAPQRLFVRNRAVDTEWQGRLVVGGTAAAPEVEGILNAVHGRFLVLGRRFRLQQGIIRFPGYPVVPYFDATAETDAAGIVARLRLSGTPQHAQWDLSSTPSLPEDEILSRVFFNRTAGASTAGQALRVAQAAEALAGGGHLTDVLDWGRRALRVDRVDFIEADSPDESARVSVGKYIGERGFVDVEKDVVRSEGGRARIHYDVAPGISLETEVESAGDRGIGLRWQRDY